MDFILFSEISRNYIFTGILFLFFFQLQLSAHPVWLALLTDKARPHTRESLGERITTDRPSARSDISDIID